MAAAATAAAVGPARGEAGEEGGEPALAGNGKSGDGDSSSAAEAEEAVAAAAAAAAAAEGAKPGGRRKRLVVVVEELPPLPEGYVPVAMLPPLPLPYCMDEATGKPEPLPGVICVFMTSECRGGILELCCVLCCLYGSEWLKQRARQQGLRNILACLAARQAWSVALSGWCRQGSYE